MKYTRYSIVDFRTEQVTFGALPQGVPSEVSFQWSTYGTPIAVSTNSMQFLRRAVPTLESGSENKIQFIKHIRGLLRCGLKEAKDIADWFFENLDRDVLL
jgi:hypothetical protein